MASANNGHVIGVVIGRIGEQLLRADIGASDAGGEAAVELERKQTRAGVPNAQLLANVTQTLVGVAIVEQDIVHAETRLVHQRGVDSPRPVDHSILEWSDIKRVVDQREGGHAGLVLPSVRVAAGEVILVADLPVELEIALVRVHIAAS